MRWRFARARRVVRRAFSSRAGSEEASAPVSTAQPRVRTMRPILLSGHERSLTQVKYNADGDIVFSCSKDHVVNAWWSQSGERLGTYAGHNGTVWTVDADCALLQARRAR